MRCDLGGARVGPPRRAPVCSTLPHLWEEQTWLQKPPQGGFSSRGQKGTHVLPTLQVEEVGLDSPSPPSVPTSNVTKVPVQKESRDQPSLVQEGTLGLDNQKRAQAQVSPLPLHCSLVVYSHVVCPQLLRRGCCSLVELL